MIWRYKIITNRYCFNWIGIYNKYLYCRWYLYPNGFLKFITVYFSPKLEKTEKLTHATFFIEYYFNANVNILFYVWHFSLGCIKKKKTEGFCICFTGDDKYVNCLQITSVLVKSRCRGWVGSVVLAAFWSFVWVTHCMHFTDSPGSWRAFELVWEPSSNWNKICQESWVIEMSLFEQWTHLWSSKISTDHDAWVCSG